MLGTAFGSGVLARLSLVLLLSMAVTACGEQDSSSTSADGEAAARSTQSEDAPTQSEDAPTPRAPSVDQPPECNIDAAGLEAAEGHSAGTYNTVELRRPGVNDGLTPNFPTCWYSHDGTAFPSTTMVIARYGTRPADPNSSLAVLGQATNAREADAALTELCPVEVQRTTVENVLICGVDAFVFGATHFYQHTDLIQEATTDDDFNSLSDEELTAIEPVLQFLSEAAK